MSDFEKDSRTSKQQVTWCTHTPSCAEVEACRAWLVARGDSLAGSGDMILMVDELLKRRRADETRMAASKPKSMRELLESASNALQYAGPVTRNLVAGWIDEALSLPDETAQPTSKQSLIDLLREAFDQIDCITADPELDILREGLKRRIADAISKASSDETTGEDLAFWKREALAATRILKAARNQFPNNDGWLNQAIDFLESARLPEEPTPRPNWDGNTCDEWSSGAQDASSPESERDE